MVFTEEDVPLMKLIFNPETHAMGMLVGGERAKNIFEYVCNVIGLNEEDFIKNISRYYYSILWDESLCNFFWDNNILQLSFLTSLAIGHILTNSPIAEKIWDSDKLDLTKLNGDDIYWILEDSPIAKKIWDSGKLNVSLLSKGALKHFKQRFDN